MSNYKVKRSIAVTLATLLMCLGFLYFGPFTKVFAADNAGNTTSEVLDISNEVTKLDMEFDKSIVQAGDNLVVTITANNVVDLKGFDLSILYNSEFFTLQDAFIHDDFGEDENSVYFDMADEPGKVRLLGTLLGEEARSGNLRIVSLILKSKSNTNGKTPIIISSGSQTSDKDAVLYTIPNDIVKDAVIANPDVAGNDGIVRINDLTKVAGCFMQSYGQNGYNSACDMDKDGIIDLFDIVYVAIILLHGADDNAVELIYTYPFNMQNDYYPRYGYLTLDFSEDMRPCNDISKISIVSSDGVPVNIISVPVGITYKRCVLIVVEDNLELNTEYTLTIPKNTLQSSSGKFYDKDININFKTAHTVLKGKIHDSGDLYNTEIWLDDKYQTFANSDGTFIFTNIDGGEYTLKVNINGHIIERKIVVVSGVVNYFDI